MALARVPKLSELLDSPERVSLLPAEAIAALRGELAKLDTLLLARLISGANSPAEARSEGDRLLNAKEASAKLSLSEDHLYRHSTQFPFTVRMGRRLRFSEAGIARYIRQRMGR